MLHPSLRIYSILMIFCLTYNFCFSSLYPAYSFGIALFCKDTLSLLNHIYRNYIHLVLCYTMNSSIYSIVLMSSYIQILELYSLENNDKYSTPFIPGTQKYNKFLPKFFFLIYKGSSLSFKYNLPSIVALYPNEYAFSIRFIIHYYFKTYNKRGTFHNGPLLFKP